MRPSPILLFLGLTRGLVHSRRLVTAVKQPKMITKASVRSSSPRLCLLAARCHPQVGHQGGPSRFPLATFLPRPCAEPAVLRGLSSGASRGQSCLSTTSRLCCAVYKTLRAQPTLQCQIPLLWPRSVPFVVLPWGRLSPPT